MSVENLDNWSLGPSVELCLVDSAYAQRLIEDCASPDREANGSQADAIIVELLRKLGMGQTAAAYEAADVWRA